VVPSNQLPEEALFEMSTQHYVPLRRSLSPVDLENNSKLTAPRPKPRVIVADDHHAMLEEMSRLLKGDFEVVAAVTNGALAVQNVADLKPDAVVLDIHMPGMDGIEAARNLMRLGSSAKIIFLTIEIDPEYVELATTMGVSYVVKTRLYHDLIIAIKEALAGRLFVSSLM